MEIRIPYGKTTQCLQIEECRVIESKIRALKASADGHKTVEEAMLHPYGGKTLREMAAGKSRAVLIISDHTRPVPSKYIVPHMLSEMREGNPDLDITLRSEERRVGKECDR